MKIKREEPLTLGEIFHLIHSFPLIYFMYRTFKADGYETKAKQTFVFMMAIGALVVAMLIAFLTN